MIRRRETLLLAFVLVFAHHAAPWWLFRYLPAREWYDQLGRNGYANLYDAITGILPLILCCAAPARSGLTLGRWRGQTLQVLAICLVPIALTAIFYRFTSQPFSGGAVGVWLISPAAQDLLFSGYLYGLIDSAFPGPIHGRVRLNKAIFLTAAFFALWHVPNFWGLPASYVSFQLLYTLLGGAWMLLTRQLTGSILPGLGTHMACNFLAWL